MATVHALSKDADDLSIPDRGALLVILFSSLLDEVDDAGEVEAADMLREMNLVMWEWNYPPEVAEIDIDALWRPIF